MGTFGTAGDDVAAGSCDVDGSDGNFGGDAAVAVDRNHIYTWDATIRIVYVYDRSGNFIESFLLDSGDNGMSLSIANGLLFVARDGNYSTGEWYGYCIKSHLNNSVASSSSIDNIQLRVGSAYQTPILAISRFRYIEFYCVVLLVVICCNGCNRL